MEPVRTFVTTDAVLVSWGERLVTVFTVFVSTVGTSPGFMGFFMQFYYIVFKICTWPVVVFFAFVTT